MKVKLTTTSNGYDKEDAEHLAKLGFQFDCSKDNYCPYTPKLKGAWLDRMPVYYNINSLDDLIELTRGYGQLIFSYNDDESIIEVEIYDGYRE